MEFYTFIDSNVKFEHTLGKDSLLRPGAWSLEILSSAAVLSQHVSNNLELSKMLSVKPQLGASMFVSYLYTLGHCFDIYYINLMTEFFF